MRRNRRTGTSRPADPPRRVRSPAGPRSVPLVAGLVVLLVGSVLAVPLAGAAGSAGSLEEQLSTFRSTIRSAVEDYEAAYADYKTADNASAEQDARERMTQAGHAVGQAFLAFEQGHGDEGSLSVFMQTEIGSGFYRSFERDVVMLRATMVDAASGDPATPGQIHARASPVLAGLDRAEGCMPDGCGSVLAGAGIQSFLVLLREGFEAILLVGAIVAYLHKTDRGDKRRHVWTGVLGGLAASLVAWLALDRAFSAAAARSSTAHAVLEGATMLLAALVLFYVSFWLLSKVESKRWRAFIDGRLKASLADDRAWMLGAIGFLAVFREGVETVLFVQAISLGSGGAWGEIGIGLLAGALALVGLYYAVHHAGVNVPLRTFFAVTGAALALLAVRFLGLGLFELQEAGWLPTTPMPDVASVLASSPLVGFLGRDLLGFAPTLEVVAGQALLVAIFLAGGLWTVLAEPQDADVARA